MHTYLPSLDLMKRGSNHCSLIQKTQIFWRVFFFRTSEQPSTPPKSSWGNRETHSPDYLSHQLAAWPLSACCTWSRQFEEREYCSWKWIGYFFLFGITPFITNNYMRAYYFVWNLQFTYVAVKWSRFQWFLMGFHHFLQWLNIQSVFAMWYILAVQVCGILSRHTKVSAWSW